MAKTIFMSVLRKENKTVVNDITVELKGLGRAILGNFV